MRLVKQPLSCGFSSYSFPEYGLSATVTFLSKLFLAMPYGFITTIKVRLIVGSLK